jgi:hypothetical protein
MDQNLWPSKVSQDDKRGVTPGMSFVNATIVLTGSS